MIHLKILNHQYHYSPSAKVSLTTPSPCCLNRRGSEFLSSTSCYAVGGTLHDPDRHECHQYKHVVTRRCSGLYVARVRYFVIVKYCITR